MKTALITGTSSGIGLETAKILLNSQIRVIWLGRSLPTELTDHDLYNHISIDLTWDICFDNLDLGVIDILVNNAGILSSCIGLWEYDPKVKEDMYKLHIDTPLALITHCLNDNPNLRVINISSMAWHCGNPDLHYGITKAGMINFTKSLASIYGSSGLVINSIAPWPIDTPMLDVLPAERKASIPSISLSWEYNTVQNVAKTVHWLALEAPNTINGSTIDINDGMYVR